MVVLMVIGVLLLVACWLVAVGSWAMALQHRKPEQSLTSHLMKGTKAFDPDNFTPEGQKHQRRFVRAFGVFFLLAFLSIGVGVLVSVMTSSP